MQTDHLRSSRLRKATAHRATRSALYQWMHDNYEDIAANQVGNTVPNWEPLRTVATEMGIRDASGREVTLAKMKRVWHEVRKGYVKPNQSERSVFAASPPRTSTAKEWVTPSKKERDLVASTSERLRFPMQEVRQPSHPESATTPHNRPSAQPGDPYANETGEENVARVMAQLRERSNRRNGVY